MGCKQFRERVFRSGMEPALRRTAWKFLLGVFPPDSSFADRQRLLAKKRQQYLGLKQQWTSITDQQAARFVLLVLPVVLSSSTVPCTRKRRCKACFPTASRAQRQHLRHQARETSSCRCLWLSCRASAACSGR